MSTDDKLNGMSSDAVKAKTGRDWSEWCALLDEAGAKAWDHKRIVAYLATEHQIGAWWQQMITVGYEQSRGLRAVNQKADGYATNGSKTVNVPIADLYLAWADETQRSQWFPDFPFTVRKATENKSMRLSAAEGSLVGVSFWDKGPGKSQVSLEHGKLPGPDDVAATKAFWAERLASLQAYLEGGRSARDVPGA